MATATVATGGRGLRRVRTRWLVAGVIVAWIVLWAVLRNRFTLALEPAQLTTVHGWLNDLRSTVDASRATSPVFAYFFDAIRAAIDAFVSLLQDLLARPAYGRPVPVIGWLGVVAIATWLAYALAGVRMAILAAVGFTFLGLQGLWEDSMYTLSLTIAAVVLALLIGIPLGVLAGLRKGIERVVTPVLDFMQTMPTFVYLAPLTLFFLIGPAAATIATLIYALPPVIRITAHGIRTVSPAALEATTSLGATRWQKLLKVQLPLAGQTIVVGVNQTMMAALSMATIAALIAAPGLGQTVINALQALDVGTAFNAGLAIVVIAIVLDRVTTAASRRTERVRRADASHLRRRRVILGVGAAAVIWAIWQSRTYLWSARFPSEVDVGPVRFSLDLGTGIVNVTTAVVTWIQENLAGVTTAVKDAVTYALLNPLQALLGGSPWFVTALAILAIAFALAGIRAVIVAAGCLALILVTGLWGDSMVTLAASLVATVIVMLFGVVVGVAMGRSARLDQVVRPVLDALQTMPAFVYLVPFLGLFGATRFTAIVAAVAYAAPVSIKLVADGIRGVPASVMEAAKSAGSTTWQTITKVQLPMTRRALTLAANQGLIYVLSMVVVGGLVGAGALGYDVVAGFSQLELYGKGLAAGIAIVLLGIMLDRITQRAAARASARPGGV
ncbi:MAG: ABC transporter permease subunit [Streptosporangiales bacterium]|nr:ABC transporter permease subunit [Streptosporangiales bacterium]